MSPHTKRSHQQLPIDSSSYSRGNYSPLSFIGWYPRLMKQQPPHINLSKAHPDQEPALHILVYISDFIVPFIILSIVIYGMLAGVSVYDTFIKGARSGFLTVIRLMPTLIGLMAAVGILRASGFLDFLASLIGQFSSHIGFPGELIPLSIVKMFSSSAATGLLLDIYKNFGTDSRLGQIASISMCCTETIFYTMSVYFMTAGIKKSRYTLAGALIATFAGLAASVLLAAPG